MPLSIGSNLASLQTVRRLSETRGELNSVYNRLSSGLRINRSADDAAGLAIASTLQSNSRVFAQGIRNFNDGLSALNIADQALESLSTIVQRLSELATQSANGSLGAFQRKALDREAQELADEYFRIARSTKFNGRLLFGGEYGELRLQGGYGTDGGIAQTFGGAIGNGSFGSTTTYDNLGPGGGAAIAIGDINGDGHQDMVSGSTPGTLTVLFGAGDGTFTQAYSTSISGSINEIALGDVNNDGQLDMVVSATLGTGVAYVLKNNGNGTFSSATSYVTEAATSASVTLGDLNNDGLLDMVSVGTGGLLGRATVRLGTGNGTFGSATSYQTNGTATTGVALGDLNGDGNLDLVTSGVNLIGTVSVLYGTGNGGFGTETEYSAEGIASMNVALGDVNNDGRLDIISGGQSAPGSSFSILLNSGNGFATAQTTYSFAGAIVDLNLADFNGDGFLDLVTNGPNLEVRLGTGAGTFGSMISYTGSAAVDIGDVNEDGVIDLITSGNGGGGQAAAFVRIGGSLPGVSPLLPFSLGDAGQARQALSFFNQKREQLAKQRGMIGAFQSRVNVAGATLQVAHENFVAAASRITDADIAEESSRLVRLGILEKAGAAVLAQANLQPTLAIELLKVN